MKSTLALGIIALIVAAGAYFFVFSGGDDNTTSSNSTTTASSTPSTSSPAATSTPEASPSGTEEALTVTTVASHSDPADCWTIIRDKVYDITSYVQGGTHPGGDAINDACGTDGTDFFEGNTAASSGAQNSHSARATSILDDFLLGDLVTL